MQSRTCFEILNLAPTSDYQAVKKQYKALLLAHHPDKGGDNAYCQEIIEAFSQINSPEKLAAYVERIRRNDSYYPAAAAAAASVPAAGAASASASRTTNQPSNTVVLKGQKIRVFYPMFLAKEYGGVDICMNFDAMISGCQIDFEAVAKVINNCLQQPHVPACQQMVGVDLDDVCCINQLHSNYKHTRGCYGVEMEVDIVDVVMERLQERENDPYQRDQRGFWRLKGGTQIKAINIISLSLVCDYAFGYKLDANDVHSEAVTAYINESRSNRRRLTKYGAEVFGVPTFYVDRHRGVDSYHSLIVSKGIRTQEEVIRQFLHDKSFWAPLTRGHAFPAGIVEMQRSNLSVDALREIAKKHARKKSQISLFNTQHAITGSFYECVQQSMTKSSIIDWIFERASSQPQSALSSQAAITARPV